jgi:hypothetical protein
LARLIREEEQWEMDKMPDPGLFSLMLLIAFTVFLDLLICGII